MPRPVTRPASRSPAPGPSWYYNGLAIFGLFVAALLIATQTSLFIDGARKRAAAKGENFFSALGAIFIKARTQSGGYLTHIGMGIILIGLVGLGDVRSRSDLHGPRQGRARASRSTSTPSPTRATSRRRWPTATTRPTSTLAVSRNGKQIGTIDPGRREFTAQQQTRLDAKVLSEPLRDIFVVFQGVQDDQATINVKINPLIWFSWGGFILMLLGTTLAMWPKKGARLVAAPAGPPKSAAKAAAKRPKPKPATR